MIKIQVLFLLIILSTETCHSLIPIERNAQSSVLVDIRLFILGGRSYKPTLSLDQILYLDVSKPFNTANPPFEVLNVSIPFGSSFATAFLSPQKDVIYLFGGTTRDVNTNVFNNIKSVLYSFNLETNEWTIPTTNGIAPENRRLINGVINNENGKFYVFGGSNDYFAGANYGRALNDMNIFDTISLTWSKGTIENAPLPRISYTATLLSNGIIVYIGGTEIYLNKSRSFDINQLSLYDTKVDLWSSMRARGAILENRYSHSAVLTSDERIIIFGGSRNEKPVLNQLAVLNTKVVPYEWSIPTPAPPLPLTTHLHSATLVGNYMFINFGMVYPKNDSLIQKPFFYILDVRNFAWVEQYEPTIVASTYSPDNAKKINIILGIVVGFSVVSIAGYLGYKYSKKQKVLAPALAFFVVHKTVLPAREEVEYYLAYEFDKVTYMLAYIHWTADVREYSAGFISFQKFGAREFIDAFAIDHCVGFFQIKTTYYVIDKDVDYTDDE
ncbi:galactose oxidase [Rhizophagus irregularis]|uniref:Galactose oxidase n=1 Tax=Rhizophagus irregularis TaxID=588596 RepID=A0A2I1G2S3_9GLOM|nr:galactose oxidase [Rhizophagus irregularis]